MPLLWFEEPYNVLRGFSTELPLGVSIGVIGVVGGGLAAEAIVRSQIRASVRGWNADQTAPTPLSRIDVPSTRADVVYIIAIRDIVPQHRPSFPEYGVSWLPQSW